MIDTTIATDLPMATFLSRRRLLQGAATLSTAAAVQGTVRPAFASVPMKAKAKLHPIVASATKNVVETDSGRVYGYARDGVVGYRGIPYADTTEQAGRFMAPQRPKPWTGARSALYWGWACPQSINTVASGRRAGWAHDDESFMFEWDDGHASEDCLRLNLWTPATDNKKRAVMLFLHGGGYVFGSDNELRAYDGENLARSQDVVVMSINHRLGVLGFLNLMEYGDQYANSPNVSMLDIVAALNWVKTNIANFGGDPGRVMIFGQSGGGAKVSTIMGMPSAKGLFHSASVQSGSGNLRQLSPDVAAKLAHATLSELGVSKANIGKLQTGFTFDQIVEAGMVAQAKLAGPGPAVPGQGIGWAPVMDGNVIPRHFWDTAAPQESMSVPLIVGTVLNEQGNSVQMGDATLDGIDMVEAKRRIAVTSGSHTDGLVEVFQKLHPKATPFEIYSRITGMRGRVGAMKQAALKAKQGGASAYAYLFAWQSPMCDGRARAFHTSELPFCFNNAELCAKITGNSPESHDLATRVSGSWAAFAKTGNPNSPGIPKWEAYDARVPTVVFDTKTVAVNDPDGEGRKAVMEAMA